MNNIVKLYKIDIVYTLFQNIRCDLVHLLKGRNLICY